MGTGAFLEGHFGELGRHPPTYDTRGNLTSAGSTTYGYDSRNQLIAAPGVALPTDPAGRLFAIGTSAGYTYLLNSGDQMIGEYSSTGTLLRRYVHGPGIDEPLVWYEGSGTSDRRYFHADERGSVIAISDGSGSVTNVNAYDEYGIPGSSNAGRFQYTGQQWLPELGMQYSRARIYSPTLGRFMQTDPIGFGGGMNIYAYVGNEPINARDPSGLGPEDPPCTDCTGPDPVVVAQRPRGLVRFGNDRRWRPRTVNEDGRGGDVDCPPVRASRPIGTDGQTRAALRDPINAQAAQWIADYARERAAARYPSLRGENDVRDAYRHFFWVYGMSRTLGTDAALRFSNAHEVEKPNGPEDRGMDVHNNDTAMAMSTDPRYRGVTTDQVYEIALANGCLRVLQ